MLFSTHFNKLTSNLNLNLTTSQFGLALFTDFNKGGAQYAEGDMLAADAVLKMHEEYGCGKSDTGQLVWSPEPRSSLCV